MIFPSHRHDPLGGPSSSLCSPFNRLMVSIAADWLPEGYDVIEGAPATLDDLRAYYRAHKRIAVELSGSGGCTMGHPEDYYAFRAWHDQLHVLYACDFSWDGERKAAGIHQAEIVRRLGYNRESFFFGALVEIEIVAQNAFAIHTGSYPECPRSFAEKWLEDRRIQCPDELLEEIPHD